MSTADAGRLVRFGAFELDLDEGVLSRYGRRVPLQEQPARILSLLVSRPDEVVTREELRQLVWTDDTFVEFDAGLNAAITKIRRALRDSASAPRFIETVPKRGYRFLADVQGLQPGSESTAVVTRGVVAPSFSAVGYRSSDRRRRTSVEHARLRYWRSWPRRFFPPGCSLPDSRCDLARRSCGRSRCSPSRCKPRRCTRIWEASWRRRSAGDSVACRHSPSNRGRLAATTDPRGLSRELGVDARLSGVATRRGQQLAIALRIVSTDGERTLWEDVVAVPVGDLMWLESQIAQRVGTALARSDERQENARRSPAT